MKNCLCGFHVVFSKDIDTASHVPGKKRACSCVAYQVFVGNCTWNKVQIFLIVHNTIIITF